MNNLKRKEIYILISFILIISGPSGLYSIISIRVSAYTLHGPISINGDTDFAEQATAESWFGDGTKGNPYIIENYEINSSSINGIEIRSTTVYFIIRNSRIYGEAKGNNGIYFFNVTNGKVDNCTIQNQLHGIRLESSFDNNISENIILYCNDGIYIHESSQTNLLNNNLSDNTVGVRLYSTRANDIRNNKAFNNIYGIYLMNSSNNYVIENNASNNVDGIYLNTSNSNNITRNTILYNNIKLEYSRENIVTGNVIVNGGISIIGNSLGHWITNNITNSNIVNGKPIIYWKNKTKGMIPNGAGQVILVNCTDILVEYQELTNTWNGIQIVYSSEIEILYNNLSLNKNCGIHIFGSEGCNIIGNNFSYNWYGILLENSNKNTINRNNANLNGKYGISVSGSNKNNIIENNLYSNYANGIYLSNSNKNDIINNGIRLNVEYGIYLSYSDENNITNNIALNNYLNGIYLDHSNRNKIIFNKANLNNWYGVYLDYSDENVVKNNNASNNHNGFYLSNSKENNIAGNNVTNNWNAFDIGNSSGNNFINNTIWNNKYGFYLSNSINNIIHHNSFINNTYQLYQRASSNTWNGSNGQGNYWSDYSGVDTDGDGVGDTDLPHQGVDYYPLTKSVNDENGEEKDSIFSKLWFMELVILFVVILVLLLIFRGQKKKAP